MQKRTYLTITPDNRAEAIRRAGKLPDGRNTLEYDPDEKLWFAREGADLSRLTDWLPENTVTGNMVATDNNLSPQEEFAGVLKDAGFILPRGIAIMDGKIQRVPTREDTDGKTSGVYRGYLDGHPAGWYEDHRSADGQVNWTSTGNRTWDPARQIQEQAMSAQRHWDRARETQAGYDRMAARLSEQYRRMPEATDAHPYLQRKGVPAMPGLRLDRYDNLVIPLQNTDNHLRILQYIKPDGSKLLKKDAEKSGNFFVVGGELRNGQPFMYAEGYATAATLHLASGLPVVMTVDAGNMVTVAGKLKEKYPDSTHIIAGDDDMTREKNKGQIKAQQTAELTGGPLIMPQFTDDERRRAHEKSASFSDFNDIHAARGLDAVRAQLAPVLDNLCPGWQQPHQKDITMPDAQTRPLQEQDPTMPLSHEAAPLSVKSAVPDTSATPPSPPPEKPSGQDAVPCHTLPSDDELMQMYLQGETRPVMPEAKDTRPPEDPFQSEPTPVAQNRTEQAAETDGILLTPERSPGQRHNAPETKPVTGQTDRPLAEQLNPDALLMRMTHAQQQDGTVLYSVDDRPAFYDHGSHLTMAPDASKQNEAVLAALLTASAHYQGRITLTGSEEFKARAISLIARYDLKVSMKSATQQAMLDDARRALHARSDRIDVAPADTAPQADAPDKNPQTASAPTAPGTAEENLPAAVPRGQYTGVLTQHGAAPYQHRENASASYYVTLETNKGLETIWGVELEKAVKEFNCRTGQMVNLNYKGKEQILIRVKEQDASGQEVIREKQVHRNNWEMKPTRKRSVKPSSAPEAGEKLSAFSSDTFTNIQRQLPLPKELPALPDIGTYLWHRPDGRASSIAGASENATPPVGQENAGQPVMTVTDDAGAKVLQLFTSAGNYLQGTAFYKGRWQHVLATLNGPDSPHAITLNAVTPQGLRHIGSADAVNNVEGKPVNNPSLLAVSLGKNSVMPARLEKPEELPPSLFRKMGFDKEWTPPQEASPKQEARARATPAQSLRPQ
ncbi:LPD7 domain-containing protein [Klebsiella grimontii]|uniref:LPD7 domain-containing protein n=1 Tax=Klebsiella grimontii TaxID=2058152 RepID=UPI00116AE409|nr:LPD7 domain-containing protein [Klebsiella grimontii]VUS41685.1 DNA primase TraC [Klebsiella grimontii]